MWCNWEDNPSGVKCIDCGKVKAKRSVRRCPAKDAVEIVKHDTRKPSLPVLCEHRGDVVRIVPCQLCGRRGNKIPVYHCNALDSGCTQRKYKGGQEEATCLSCSCRLEPGASAGGKSVV